MRTPSLTISLLLFAGILRAQQPADLVVHHGLVYTVNARFDVAEAFAVKDGRILAVGKNTDILRNYRAKTILDAGGKTIYPGFIDAHAHFYRYGLSLQRVNLMGTKSWDEILKRVRTFAAANPAGWLTGRGWDQNDWAVQEFPDKQDLDQLFPDRPVILTRVDGHAAIANQTALDQAGVKPGQTLTGGSVETKNGVLTGILIDNAIELVSRVIPNPSREQSEKALLGAAQNCFAVGLTTVDDCGLMANEVDIIDSLQRKNQLRMRLYVMLSDDSLNYARFLPRGIYKTDRLNVRSFKVYGDGALGSRGACMLAAYADRPDWRGFLLSTPGHFQDVAQRLAPTDFQMCTHAIGDSANRTMLRIYAAALRGKNDKRWRIEHAQVINQADFRYFGENNIVPSVQPTHATSDMYWALARLGATRLKGAYAFKQLLNQNQWIPLGTDFPVEDISPFATFFSAVYRRDAKGFPKGGFGPENALSRVEALRGMTIWAAKSNFEEAEKGSIEPGKFADFILLNQDLMKADSGKILDTLVEATYLNGEVVFKR
ncbi:MAG: amidohydrolase [Cytophagaceae bacterium]|nr:amidohydrolase [Cytophagaceae bacterium]